MVLVPASMSLESKIIEYPHCYVVDQIGAKSTPARAMRKPEPTAISHVSHVGEGCANRSASTQPGLKHLPDIPVCRSITESQSQRQASWANARI